VAAALEACADILERHGGHPAAAGCHIDEGLVPALRTRLVDFAAGQPPVDPRPSLAIDLVQSALDTDYVLLRELSPLEDAAEAPPLVGVAGLAVVRARVASGGHTQLTLRRGRDVIDGISFGRADLAEQLTEGLMIDVVARLTSRTFAGLETLQLEVRDVAAANTLAGLRDAERGVTPS
jgi:single-stranded-DNA-specific exonuclease